MELSTQTLANLLYSLLAYNTQDNELETLKLFYLELNGGADFSNIYAQIENVSTLYMNRLNG